MDLPTENYKNKIEIEERYNVFSKFQKELELEGVIPPTPALFLRRYRKILESISGVLIGVAIGISSMILVFYVVNFILHIEF